MSSGVQRGMIRSDSLLTTGQQWLLCTLCDKQALLEMGSILLLFLLLHPTPAGSI